ncbi:hypothetical protein G6O67_007344 [Ophiocordyceps sinensis]|uniref:Uncharacterized protein n=1 Tax=Ophiocordyceps sinensis TaxID=72228 RepID=A0A8H4PKW4_9HYPO|nr:hypothetical protein G6O67_007344 [Ophiocordyceps sinensis]
MSFHQVSRWKLSRWKLSRWKLVESGQGGEDTTAATRILSPPKACSGLGPLPSSLPFPRQRSAFRTAKTRDFAAAAHALAQETA